MLKKSTSGLVLKLDFANAYDNVEWEIFFSMMEEWGFGARWISWNSYCISTTTLAVLVNGSPNEFFAQGIDLSLDLRLLPM